MLGLDLTGVIAAASRRLTADEAARLEDFARRRLDGEPVARILGLKEFWGLPLKLSAATLVPRPDTETVVELALEMLRAGAASGSSAAHRRHRHRFGCDSAGAVVRIAGRVSVSAPTSAWLRCGQHSSNAVDLGLADRAGFVACDYAAALSGPFDLIVSNPPYIRSAEIAGLATEVRDHDPRRRWTAARTDWTPIAPSFRRPHGCLRPAARWWWKSGRAKAADIEGLMTAAGLTVAAPAKADLAGIRRAVAGRKLPP